MPQQIMWTPPRATRSRILIRPRHHSRKPLISIQVKKKLKKYRNSVIIDCYTDCIFAFVQGQLTSSCIMNHSFLGIEVKFLFLLTLWNCGSIFVYINCKHLYSICCIFIFFLLLNRVCNVIFYLFFHDTNSSGPLKKQANTFFNSFSISPRYYIIKLTKI